MINPSLGSSIQEDIAKELSSAVLSSADETGSKILSQGLDLFVRDTKGGREVVSKIGLYTALPYLAVGFMLGWLVKGK